MSILLDTIYIIRHCGEPTTTETFKGTDKVYIEYWRAMDRIVAYNGVLSLVLDKYVEFVLNRKRRKYFKSSKLD